MQSFLFLTQIYEIIKNAQVGSYSLITLGLSLPVNVIWTVFLANWSFLAKHHPVDDPDYGIDQVWYPYMIMTGTQFVTLMFGWYYTYGRGVVRR
jgi:hypothetical protein